MRAWALGKTIAKGPSRFLNTRLQYTGLVNLGGATAPSRGVLDFYDFARVFGFLRIPIACELKAERELLARFLVEMVLDCLLPIKIQKSEAIIRIWRN